MLDLEIFLIQDLVMSDLESYEFPNLESTNLKILKIIVRISIGDKLAL
jgi:hypothetical protein